MGWIAGIIALIVAIRFWRVSLPLIGIAALGIGGVFFFQKKQNEKCRFLTSYAVAEEENRRVSWGAVM